MCDMDDNLSGHNHGMQPYYDVALGEKKKKKKKTPATSGGGSVGIAVACAIGGALVSRGIRYVTVKFVPMENKQHKRAIADGVSTVIGGGTAFVFKNPYLKSLGVGILAEAVVDGGALAVEMFMSEPVSVNGHDDYDHERVNGHDDYDQERVNGHDDYDERVNGHDDEPQSRIDLSGMDDIGNKYSEKTQNYW
jgi:hypothetical protein